MKAVAIITPVPKCLTEKNTHLGILRRRARVATIGNSAPLKLALEEENDKKLPKVEVKRSANRAAMCNPNSNSFAESTVSSK